MKRIERLESVLVCSGADGNRASAPAARWEIDLSRPRLLVVGRWLATGAADVRDGARFVQLWLGDEERPYELEERELTAFDFLGARRQPSQRVNFQLVIDALAKGASLDESLIHHAARVQETVKQGGDDAGHYSLKTSVDGANVVSRLLRLRWRASLGPATPPPPDGR